MYTEEGDSGNPPHPSSPSKVFEAQQRRIFIYASEESMVKWQTLIVTYLIAALYIYLNTHKVMGICLVVMTVVIYLFVQLEFLIYYIVDRHVLRARMRSRYYLLGVRWLILTVMGVFLIWLVVYIGQTI